jgi:hypothetical protein
MGRVEKAEEREEEKKKRRRRNKKSLMPVEMGEEWVGDKRDDGWEKAGQVHRVSVWLAGSRDLVILCVCGFSELLCMCMCFCLEHHMT